MEEWHVTASGDPCSWCPPIAGYEGWITSDFEPEDDDDAYNTLCRGHLAEYLGESLAGLDRMEAAQRADMEALGYFDR